jgi:hypothetical protein
VRHTHFGGFSDDEGDESEEVGILILQEFGTLSDFIFLACEKEEQSGGYGRSYG